MSTRGLWQDDVPINLMLLQATIEVKLLTKRFFAHSYDIAHACDDHLDSDDAPRGNFVPRCVDRRMRLLHQGAMRPKLRQRASCAKPKLNLLCPTEDAPKSFAHKVILLRTLLNTMMLLVMRVVAQEKVVHEIIAHEDFCS